MELENIINSAKDIIKDKILLISTWLCLLTLILLNKYEVNVIFFQKELILTVINFAFIFFSCIFFVTLLAKIYHYFKDKKNYANNLKLKNQYENEIVNIINNLSEKEKSIVWTLFNYKPLYEFDNNFDSIKKLINMGLILENKFEKTGNNFDLTPDSRMVVEKYFLS